MPSATTQPSFQDRLLTLVEKAGDIVWTVDLSMKPTFVSASIQHQLGYTADEALKLTMRGIFTPEAYEKAMRALAEEVPSATSLEGRTRILELELIHKDGRLVPFEVCYSAICDACGRPTEVMAVARNIAERRLMEEEARANTRKVIESLGQTVQALAAMAELRDPYTAGHQRRVSDLACAIAQELGLSRSASEGLRLAGLIHDIGKIRIPSEILMTTRPLTAAEFEIVKTHPTVGYEVLKDISFPWPIAETVYQHHERLDGSGYPRGLGRHDIILEARILGVADVVEAIASERPYRKSLGVGAALQELCEHRSNLYDPAVVDACLSLFQRQRHRLDDTELMSPTEDQ
jgi:PAS domain S-box-containing protein/putative nucleotidyltransferase with HDIG domain